MRVRMLYLMVLGTAPAVMGQEFLPVVDTRIDTIMVRDRRWTMSASYVAGYKYLGEGWHPAEHQFEFGLVDLDYTRRNWPFSLVGRMLLSWSSTIPRQPGFTGTFSGSYEITTGVRKKFMQRSRFQPELAAGAGFTGASLTTQINQVGYVQEDHDAGFGWWIEAGFFWMFSRRWITGIAYLHSRGEVTLFGKPIQAGGDHGLIFIGYRY